jgi:hypothetical protein
MVSFLEHVRQYCLIQPQYMEEGRHPTWGAVWATCEHHYYVLSITKLSLMNDLYVYRDRYTRPQARIRIFDQSRHIHNILKRDCLLIKRKWKRFGRCACGDNVTWCLIQEVRRDICFNNRQLERTPWNL